MTKQDIIELLINDEVGNGIKALRAALPNDNIVLNLAGQWNRLQKDITARQVSNEYATLSENQISNGLLDMARKLPDDVQVNIVLERTSPTPVAPVVPKQSKGPIVFLSYNHNDAEDAAKVKAFLEGRNIQVTIDSEAMQLGEDIATFINNCIKEADVTLSLVSSKSLLSAWVGMESMNTLVGEKIADKKFIAVVIDSSFYKMSFVRESTKVIDDRLKELDEEIAFRMKDGIGIEDIQGDLTRNRELRHGLSKIVANLKNRLNVDINGANFDAGMDRVSKAILNK